MTQFLPDDFKGSCAGFVVVVLKAFLTRLLEKYKKNQGIYSTPISLVIAGETRENPVPPIHSKDFCAKNVPKLPDFEENISEIHHLVIDPLENPVQLIQEGFLQKGMCQQSCQISRNFNFILNCHIRTMGSLAGHQNLASTILKFSHLQPNLANSSPSVATLKKLGGKTNPKTPIEKSSKHYFERSKVCFAVSMPRPPQQLPAFSPYWQNLAKKEKIKKLKKNAQMK